MRNEDSPAKGHLEGAPRRPRPGDFGLHLGVGDADRGVTLVASRYEVLPRQRDPEQPMTTAGVPQLRPFLLGPPPFTCIASEPANRHASTKPRRSCGSGFNVRSLSNETKILDSPRKWP